MLVSRFAYVRRLVYLRQRFVRWSQAGVACVTANPFLAAARRRAVCAGHSRDHQQTKAAQRAASSTIAIYEYPPWRRRTAATITSLQEPPRAVGTPRAVRARATPRRLLTPLAWISLMMGRTLAANASASSLRAAIERRRASSNRGPPSFLPRPLAAARAALVRSEIASRSCSATAARMWMVSLLACGLSVATNSTPESIRAAMKARWDRRSSFAMQSLALWRRQAARAF